MISLVYFVATCSNPVGMTPAPHSIFMSGLGTLQLLRIDHTAVVLSHGSSWQQAANGLEMCSRDLQDSEHDYTDYAPFTRTLCKYLDSPGFGDVKQRDPKVHLLVKTPQAPPKAHLIDHVKGSLHIQNLQGHYMYHSLSLKCCGSATAWNKHKQRDTTKIYPPAIKRGNGRSLINEGFDFYGK